MYARRESMVASRLQNSTGFVRAEDTLLAKDVTPLRQSLGRNSREHLVHDEAHIVFTMRAIFQWNLVRTHEGWRQFDRL